MSRRSKKRTAQKNVMANEDCAMVQIQRYVEAPLSKDLMCIVMPVSGNATWTPGCDDPTGVRKAEYDSLMRISQAMHQGVCDKNNREVNDGPGKN